jgi:hypothetical protein
MRVWVACWGLEMAIHSSCRLWLASWFGARGLDVAIHGSRRLWVACCLPAQGLEVRHLIATPEPMRALCMSKLQRCHVDRWWTDGQATTSKSLQTSTLVRFLHSIHESSFSALFPGRVSFGAEILAIFVSMHRRLLSPPTPTSPCRPGCLCAWA